MTSPMPGQRSLLAKNSVFNFLGQLIPMFVGVVTIPYIIRGLGPDGYGILSIAFMVLGYFSIFDLGLSRATVKFVAEHLSPEKAQKIPELVWTSLCLLCGLGIVGGTLIAVVVPYGVTHVFKMPASFFAQAETALFILAAAMPIMLGADALRGVLEAAQRFDLVNYVKVPSSICFYLLAALAIPLGLKVPGIVLLLVLVRFATAVLYLLLCFKVFPGLKRFQLSAGAIRPLSTFGGWIMVSNIAGPIFGYLERFLIASVLSVAMLTYYSAPFDLVSKVVIFPASIAPALFPYFSYHGRKGSDAVLDVTSRSIKYLVFLMTPVTVIFVLFAGDILRLWLGPVFAAQSAVVLQLIALTYFLNAFAFIPFTSVQALGRPDLKATLDIVALPLYAATCWWLMKHMGINGAALAKVIVTIFDCGFLFAFAWKLKAFSLFDCFSGLSARALAVGASLLGAASAIKFLHLNLIPSAFLLVVCLLFYVVAFVVFATDSNEREVLHRLSWQLVSKPKQAGETPGTPRLAEGD